MSRPTDLTEAVQETILREIREGNYVETACLVAGVTYQSYYNWMKWGREGKEPYAQFFESCARARAEEESSLVKVARAGDGKGESYGPSKAALTFLERTRPRKFSPRLNISLDKELDKIMGIAEKTLEPDQYAKLVEAICAAAGSSEEAGED